MTTIYIYGLVCPIEGKVMYVGKAQNTEARLRQHLLGALSGDKSIKSQWLRQLQIKNLIPSIEIIDCCVDGEWRERESYWIEHHRSINPGLKNSILGGARPGPRCTTRGTKATFVNIRVSEEQKKMLAELASDYGTSLTDFIILMAEYVRDTRPTFQVKSQWKSKKKAES